MKMKGIIAVSLVFSIAFALGACRKVEKGSKNEGENYNNGMFVVDSIGETHEVETQLNEDTGETEYVYKDDLGNVVVVEKKDVGQTQYNPSTTVTGKNGQTVAGETQTLPENISEFFEGLTDPNEDGAEYLEEQQAELTISDELIDTDEMKEVSPPLSDNGTPRRSAMDDFAAEIKKNKQYTIKMTAKNVAPNGETSIVPFTVMRSGNNMYMESQFPIDGNRYITIRALIKDGKCIIYIPSIRAYMELPSDSLDEILNGVDQYTDPDKDPELIGEYKSSGQVSVGGVTYNVDIYEDEDGSEVKYYYQGDNLKRVESVDKSGNTTIIEYESITNTVDKSKFVAPTGYFNLGNISNEDQLAALLG